MVGEPAVTHSASIEDGLIFEEAVPTGRRTSVEVVVRASREGDQLFYDAEIVELTERRRGTDRHVLSRPRIVTGGPDKAATISQGSMNGRGELIEGFTLTITPI